MTHKDMLDLLCKRLWAVKRFTGISVPDPLDKSTWTIDFYPGTLEAEKAALQKVLDEFEHSFVQAEQ